MIRRIKPIFKEYLWGGEKLKSLFDVKNFNKVAEEWLLSSHPDGKNIDKDVPIIIKLIDAKDNLSLQVHPDDEYATKLNDNGKNECWYILSAEENSEIIYGCKEKFSKEQVENAIKNNTILDIVNHVKVKPGEIYYIPAGTVHAIGKEIELLEVQQSSNLTFRLYDYNRKDKDGKTRKLHIKEALEVMHLGPAITPKNVISGGQTYDFPCGKVQDLILSPTFDILKVDFKGQIAVPNRPYEDMALVSINGATNVVDGPDEDVIMPGDLILLNPSESKRLNFENDDKSENEVLVVRY